jgi:hypothetical protein
MKPFTDDDVLEMAARDHFAESVVLPLGDLARIIIRLPPAIRPSWLMQRLQAATEVHVMLTRAELMELVERMLGKSGEALEYAINEHAAAAVRADKPSIGKAGSPAARQ